MKTQELDISDIIQNAVKERAQFLANRKRPKEIEAQIEALNQELENLPTDSYYFIPKWRTELDKRVEDAILSLENTESSHDV